MADTEIRCTDCKAKHLAKRRSAKRCPPCSLLAVALYGASKFKRTRRCRACGDPYYPLRAADGALCGRCFEPYARAPVKCHFCGHERGSVDPRVPVCIVCIKDPEGRRSVIRAMQDSQKARKNGTSVRNATTLPERMSATDVQRKTQIPKLDIEARIREHGLERPPDGKYATSELLPIFKELPQ